MPKTNNGFVLSSILLLVSMSLFSHISVAFGSPVQEQRFHRPDPLRHFKFYKGGYDLKNKHYWAQSGPSITNKDSPDVHNTLPQSFITISAAFTGVHGYAIGGVWILCGLVFVSYIVLTRSFKGSSSSTVAQNSNSLYIIVFFLVLLLSFLAIVTTGLVIAANQSSSQRTKKLEETVLGAGGEARKTIRKVTDAMNEMQKLLLPYDPKTCSLLISTSYQLGRESRLIRNFGRKYEHSISKAIQISYVANLAIVSINLGFLAASVVLLFFHWQPGFVIIILLCWILTTLCWVLTGFDFFFHTFARDTCTALADYEQNPQNNSLSSLLPCSNPTNSDKVLVDIGYTVHNSIKELNAKITQFSNLVRLEEDQDDSSFGVEKICDPFSGAPNFSYAPENCPKDSIPIGALPGVISRFTCYKDNNKTNCESNGRFIPEASYLMVWAYSSALQDLINIFPDLQNLIQCSFVKETFLNVVLHQCKPFRAATRRLWLSVLCLSIIMVVLVLLWAAKAHQDRRRSFSGCSIFPNPTV